jgi:hypothetical protein
MVRSAYYNIAYKLMLDGKLKAGRRLLTTFFITRWSSSDRVIVLIDAINHRSTNRRHLSQLHYISNMTVIIADRDGRLTYMTVPAER